MEKYNNFLFDFWISLWAPRTRDYLLYNFVYLNTFLFIDWIKAI